MSSRLYVGREVNLNYPVILSQLSPLDRVITAFRDAFRRTSLFKRRQLATQEAEEQQHIQHREYLTRSLLSILQQELSDNTTLCTYDDTCIKLQLMVSSGYTQYLPEVLSLPVFDGYIIKEHTPCADLIHMGVELPHLLTVEVRRDVL